VVAAPQTVTIRNDEHMYIACQKQPTVPFHYKMLLAALLPNSMFTISRRCHYYKISADLQNEIYM